MTLTRPARAAFLVIGVLFAILALARPATAASAESITSLDTRIEVQADGRMHVTETIIYDFGGDRRHGIRRDIPYRFPVSSRKNREYPISSITVSRDGRPEPYLKSASGGVLDLKIGSANDADMVSGSHTYVIAYTVAGALNHFADHDELYWNAVGAGWQVPVEQASATVTMPGLIQRVVCYQGPDRSTASCRTASFAGSTATFGQPGLGPGEAMTVVVAIPLGAVANTAPILTDRHDGLASFQPTPLALGAASALGALGIAVAAVAGWIVGRDRRYAGLLPGLTPGYGQQVPETRKPIYGAPPVSVEFVPPDGIRPGQVGTLVDERADSVDVVATIVDFAVRKHLRIRELPEARRPDWELAKLTDGDKAFLAYERALFDAIFRGRDSVRLSELRNTFASDFAATKSSLYADMVNQGWYRRSPLDTRKRVRGLGVLALLIGVGITILLAVFTQLALIGIGLIIGALALVVNASRFPARTGKGSAALARVQGFRLYVATAEAEQIKWEEREQIFSRYLPYAMVFGLAERWAKVFGDLGTVQPDGSRGLYWYSGAPNWTFVAFAHSFDSFTATTAHSLTSTPPSASGSSGFSGGGFSGGGAGGGGGGSW